MGKTKLPSQKKRRGRPRKRPLRGEALIRAAQMELARMVNDSPKTNPINMLRLAKRIGVTRKSLYNNGLRDKVLEFAEIQRNKFSTVVGKTASRRPLEARIATLEKEKEELRRLLDGWIERWAAVEYNAKLYGIDADLLFAPITPPQRKVLTFKGGRKRR